ncbi:MAG: YkoF family thiamine/hydroxymethylpyrimidine-binding protein [Candidatus Brocadiia bacterium]
MEVEAEVSLYPLGEKEFRREAELFVEVLREHGSHVEVGDMSYLVEGESDVVFDALRAGYEYTASRGGCVLVVKACNACSL